VDAQHLKVHVTQALDVQTALAGPVRAELRDLRGVPGLEPSDQVDRELGGLWREADERPLPALPGVVPVAVVAEADDP
jgi:hypothetical protein